MSIAVTLRDATTGHIRLDQLNDGSPRWKASADLKPIIAQKLGLGDSAVSEGAPADGPIEAILELVNYLDNTLWRFDRIIET